MSIDRISRENKKKNFSEHFKNRIKKYIYLKRNWRFCTNFNPLLPFFFFFFKSVGTFSLLSLCHRSWLAYFINK